MEPTFHPGVIIHLGAGKHSELKRSQYRKICKEACQKALSKSHSSLEMVQSCIILMENHPLLNAGYGSNLTRKGSVECDASIMSFDGSFGSVGAVSGIRNPIRVAAEVLKQSKAKEKHGLIQPIMIVGENVKDWIRSKMPEIECKELLCESDGDLITAERQKEYENFIKLINSEDKIKKEIDSVQDTVGAVCMDKWGNISSGVSSGGIWLKHPGRIGEAAIYGAGCWADSDQGDGQIGISISGTGEQIMRTLLAKTLSDRIMFGSRDATISDVIKTCFTRDVLNSRHLISYKDKNAGVIFMNKQGAVVEYGYAFTTNSFIVASQFGESSQLKFSFARRGTNPVCIRVDSEKLGTSSSVSMP